MRSWLGQVKLSNVFLVNSELSLINQAEINKKIYISNDLRKIIESSIEFNKISNGAFDVTLGNTINQLGFGPKIFLNQKDNVIDYQEKFLLDDNLFQKLGINQ